MYTLIKKLFWVGGQHGQVLLEVLTSMILLLIMSATIMSAYTQSSKWMTQARLRTEAGCLCSSLIEIMRAGNVNGGRLAIAGRGWVPASELGMDHLQTRNMTSFVMVDQVSVADNLYILGVKAEWDWKSEKNTAEMYTRIRGQT